MSIFVIFSLTGCGGEKPEEFLATYLDVMCCKDEDKVLEDLKISQDKLGGSTYFAYPFFDFNDRAISLLKKAGFKLAFIGQYNTDGYSYPNKTDKYKIPRKTIFSTTTMEEFIGYLE